MLEINPSSARPELSITQTRNARPEATRSTQNASSDRTHDQDRVELSPGAQEQVAAATDQRLSELRASIASGTYLTSEKIDYVVDRLSEELFGRSDAA